MKKQEDPHPSGFQHRDQLPTDPEIHVNNQKTFKKPVKNWHTEDQDSHRGTTMWT